MKDNMITDELKDATEVGEDQLVNEVVVDEYGNIAKTGESLERVFAKVDKMRHDRFVRENKKKKEKYIFMMNTLLSDKEISMHQVVFNEPSEKGMVKLSVRELINLTSNYSEKRDDVSKIILKATYCNSDIMAALREYCARVDIARWIKANA